MTVAYINKIATKVPANELHGEFIDFAVDDFEGERNKLIFRRMVERSQISRRWAAIPGIKDFYHGNPNAVDLHTRLVEYERLAPLIAIDTVNELDLGDQAEDITHLIAVTCTGFYMPGLDFDIIRNCGVNPSVERTQVAFTGCYAGVNGSKLAHHIVRSQPRAKVLLVALEMCSLHLQASQSLETMLSYLIFSDGCAAAVISGADEGLAIDSFKAVVIPDTRDLMTLRIGERSVEMFLSGKVPGALGRALKEEQTMKLILDGGGKDSVDLWAIHPGGRSILDAVGSALEFDPADLAISRHVLDNYGNMASSTILFVLEEVMRRNVGGGSKGCAMGFGPGLAAETMLFRV